MPILFFDIQEHEGEVQLFGAINDGPVEKLSIEDLERGSFSNVVIFYSRYEVSILKQQGFTFKQPVICLHELSKQKFPKLTTWGIRAVSGYLGVNLPVSSENHVEATREIWHRLPKQQTPALFKIKKRLRQDLPRLPGCYIYKNSANEILYVGKATNLYQRVNSYFSGFRRLERRKRELILSASQLEYLICESPTHAAMREVQLIQEYRPNYNTQLQPKGFQFQLQTHFGVDSSLRNPLFDTEFFHLLEYAKNWIEGNLDHTRSMYDLTEYSDEDLESTRKWLIEKTPSLSQFLVEGHRLFRQGYSPKCIEGSNDILKDHLKRRMVRVALKHRQMFRLSRLNGVSVSIQNKSYDWNHRPLKDELHYDQFKTLAKEIRGLKNVEVRIQNGRDWKTLPLERYGLFAVSQPW